ncbi:hypothetical protein BGZ63DRAFT_398540 [Mariannaea sp. PMI_226]|nr:hypothetical protein BGZ63DRAFT_398540 [Mariannaea sp. PMI_226]
MSEGPKKEPTAAEAMLFFSIVKNTKNKADVDWEAVATEQGFKNAEVAKVRFGQVKRKLGISSETGTVTGTPVRTPSKKSAGNIGLGPITPSRVAKTPRGKGKGRGKVKKEEARDDEDLKEMVTPIKAERDESDVEDPDEQLQAENSAKLEPF